MNLDRYARQIRFAPLGEAGQRKLCQSRALVCGCGALGSVIANTLVRAGVGKVRIVDRDFLELNNLQRQVLYDEDDLARNLPKAVPAAEKLRRINSQIRVESVVAEVVSSVARNGKAETPAAFSILSFTGAGAGPWIEMCSVPPEPMSANTRM